jgi:hypothetical protein
LGRYLTGCPTSRNRSCSKAAASGALPNPDGATIVERLVTFDQRARNYSYAILQAPFPITNYLSTLRVEEADNGKGSRVDWSGQFAPSRGGFKTVSGDL